MIKYVLSLNPIVQVLVATLFTYGITALGAALVFFIKKVNKSFMDGMLGFSAGIMIAASFFSLLKPSIEMINSLKLPLYLIIIGFVSEVYYYLLVI